MANTVQLIWINLSLFWPKGNMYKQINDKRSKCLEEIKFKPQVLFLLKNQGRGSSPLSQQETRDIWHYLFDPLLHPTETMLDSINTASCFG